MIGVYIREKQYQQQSEKLYQHQQQNTSLKNKIPIQNTEDLRRELLDKQSFKNDLLKLVMNFSSTL